MSKSRPFLKWAGNKYRCIDQILKALPPSERLIEPFTGSGAVFLNSPYQQYLLAEQNNDLIQLYNHIKQDGLEFIEFCRSYFCENNNTSQQFYQFREQFNQCHDDTQTHAALFLYLNRHGYNGLCRYNSSGGFNVPFGRYIKPYFPYQEMLEFHHKSQHAQFLQADFRQTFELAQTGDVIYCDPPYVALSDSAYFSTYTRKRFSEIDQIALATLAKKTAERGVTVIISNHDTAFTREHYHPAQIISFPVKRSISCKANHRQTAQELIAIFNQCLHKPSEPRP